MKKIDVFQTKTNVAFNSRSLRCRPLSEAVRRCRNHHVMDRELIRVLSFQDAETSPYSISTFNVSILSTSSPKGAFLAFRILQVLG